MLLNRKNILTLSGIIVLVASGLILFLNQHFKELNGHDNFRQLTALYAYGQWDVIPNDFSINGLLDWFRINFHILFIDRHGILPGFIIGPIYQMAEALGIPITITLLLVPQSLITILAGIVFFIFCYSNGFSFLISLTSSLFILSSPLLSSLSRIQGGTHLTMPVLAQVLMIWSVLEVSKQKPNKKLLVASLGPLIVVLSDNAFLISLGVLAVSICFWGTDFSRKPLKDIFGRIKDNFSLLANKKLFRLPIYATLFYLLFFIIKHSSHALGMNGANFNNPLEVYIRKLYFIKPIVDSASEFGRVEHIYNCLAMLGGELFPFLAIVLIIFAMWYFLNNKLSFLWSYTVISILLYGTLFFFISKPSMVIAFGYQIYLIVPFALLVALVCREIGNKLTKRKYMAQVLQFLILTMLIASSVLGHLILIYRMPYNIWDSALTYRRSYIDYSAGVEIGEKALGYLIRRVTEEAVAWEVSNTLTVNATKMSTGLCVFGELQTLFGDAKTIPRNSRIPQKYGLKYACQPLFEEKDIYSMLPYDTEVKAPLAVLMDFSSFNTDTSQMIEMQIYSKQKLKAALYVMLPAGVDRLPIMKQLPGKMQLDFLNNAFERTYNKLEDYFFF